ncbi:MAG: transferrin-binding protein-like solute binding protein [Alphaproteobacteria bacterium]|nr:transferrin-binding protein-like solute binding protein [Alphaproteobacteria bacterium]
MMILSVIQPQITRTVILVVKKFTICWLLLLLTACGSTPVTDDNVVDYTDYNTTGNSGGGGDSLTVSIATSVETDSTLQKQTAIAENSSNVAYESLTAASDDANGADRVFTLQALTMQKKDNTINTTRTISLTQITLPAVSLTFDGDGKISKVSAYFADKTYEANAASDSLSATKLTSSIASGADSSATTTAMTVDRSSDFFGFDTKYMAHVSWRLQKDESDSVFDNNGVLIGGMETEIVNIPSSGDTSFTGKGSGAYGSGAYGSETENYQTIFDIVANINFANSTADIESNNTMQCTQVNICEERKGKLDFTTTTSLDFSDGNDAKNDLSGDLELTGDASFTGKIFARFYGPGADELGGVFALAIEDKEYYYGSFGADNVGFLANDMYDEGDGGFPVVATTSAEGKNVDYLDYASLSLDDASAGAMTDSENKTLILQALAVQARDFTSSTFLQRITTIGGASPFFEITFNSSGHISAAKAFFGNQEYGLNPSNPPSSSNTLAGSVNSESSPTNKFNVIRADSNLLADFAPKYMAYVTWELVDPSNPAINSIFNGYMVAGIETPTTGANGIPIENITDIFRGNGIGTYHSDADSHHADVKFDVKAKVNFAKRTVVLSSSNTACIVATCGLSVDDLFKLEFSTSNPQWAKYVQGMNDISGDIANDGGNMAGRFDARFYGVNAAEIGGTFIMKDGDDNSTYYLGAFGAAR